MLRLLSIFRFRYLDPPLTLMGVIISFGWAALCGYTIENEIVALSASSGFALGVATFVWWHNEHWLRRNFRTQARRIEDARRRFSNAGARRTATSRLDNIFDSVVGSLIVAILAATVSALVRLL